MLRPISPPLATAFFLLASAPSAQQIVCVRGLVERAPPISICVTASGSHEFRCPRLNLDGGRTVNLQPYEGQVVEVCGTVAGTGQCRGMAVASVRAPVDHLRISGQFTPGGQVTFDLGVTPATLFVVFIGSGRGWTELGPPGVLTLDRTIFLANGLLDGSGRHSFPATIPFDAVLRGVWLYFQAAFVDLSTLAPSRGNNDCFQIM